MSKGWSSQKWWIIFMLLIATVFYFVFNLLLASKLSWRSTSISTSSVQSETGPNQYVVTTVPIVPTKCTFYTCFDPYKCSHVQYEATNSCPAVFVPIAKKEMSREYIDLLDAGRQLTPSAVDVDRNNACFVISGVDTLDANSMEAIPDLTGNTIIFNMIPRSSSGVFDLNVGSAIVASTAHLTYTIRDNFDISIPFFYQTTLPESPEKELQYSTVRKNTILFTSSETADVLTKDSRISFTTFCSSPSTNHITTRCHVSVGEKSLTDAMLNSEFCVLPSNSWYSQSDLALSLASGCIPVLTTDLYVLPFEEVIDWRETAVLLYGRSEDEVVKELMKMKKSRRELLRKQGEQIYQKYFASMRSIVTAVFDILTSRISPVFSLVNSASPAATAAIPMSITMQNLKFYRGLPRDKEKFTAVILTYDRVDSVFTMIKTLMDVPTLDKVIVVWNNQHKKAPVESAWPEVDKPLKVIHMWSNKITNRFLPFPDITTDAVLSLDDDMTSLTPDEILFGFRIWQENPSRLVGFVSGANVWDSLLSEWIFNFSGTTTHSSIVSTGAAFYHRVYSNQFLETLPREIMSTIEDIKSCDDVAFNFFIANITQQPPIRIRGSGLSKCDTCKTPVDKADIRSTCVELMSKLCNSMPLQQVEYQVEPFDYLDLYPMNYAKYKLPVMTLP